MKEVTFLKKGEYYMIYNAKTKCTIIGAWNRRTLAHQVFDCDSEVCNPFVFHDLHKAWSTGHYFALNQGWKFFELTFDEACNHVMVYTI
jgi:hypothetical protein